MRYRARATFALIVLWPVFSSSANCQTPDAQIEQSFRAGQTAMQQGQFALAADDFKKVLGLDPTLVEAQVNLGLAYQGLLEYELATRYLAKALHQRPNLLGPTVIVGMDYVKLGSPERGLPYLQTALKLDPSNRDAREALASSYLTQDRFQEAAEQFRTIAALTSDKSEACFRLGHEYLDLGARLAYRGAQLYPDSAWGHRFLGDLVYQRARWQDAVDEYGKALTSDGRQPGLHAAIGQAYLHAGKLKQAETEFRSELQLDPKSEAAWLGMADVDLARNRAAATLEDLSKVWQISPEFLALQKDFPATELTQNVANAFLSGLQEASESAPKHFLFAVLFTSANDSTHAESEARSFQKDLSAWQKQGSDQTGDQHPCESHRYSHCIQSLEGRKHFTNSERLQLGKAYFTLQRYEAAAEALSQVRGSANENAEASYWLESTYQELGAQAYTLLETSFPDSWRSHQLRAESYALRGNVQEALHEFDAALISRPDEPELREALGELYLDNHNYQMAQRELEQALAADPVRTHALYLLGRVFVEQKDNEKAVPYLERALRIQPDLTEANSLLGTAYLRLGRFDNAVAKLEKAAPSDHVGNVHYQLFVAYRKLGQPERAKQELLLSKNLRRSFLERDQAMIMGAASQPEAELQ